MFITLCKQLKKSILQGLATPAILYLEDGPSLASSYYVLWQ